MLDKDHIHTMINNAYMKFLMTFFGLLSVLQFGSAQENKKIIGDSLYQINIKKTRLYGVYIPKDITDALGELDKLSTDEARKSLLNADEKTIAKKLRFGIGRWMEYNWNFQEGSRFSHFLREQKGLVYPDDMVEYMIILFYRHNKKMLLQEDVLAEELVKKRNELLRKEREKNTIGIIKK
jgi:hypothetical protein